MSRPAPAPIAERPLPGAPEGPLAWPDRIGVLAGGGRLPLTIAERVIERGGSVHIVAIEGEADPAVAGFPHTWVNWGQVGRMVSTLRRHADALVIAGSVRRPDLWKLRPDWGFFVSLPRILEMMAGGDDSVLSRVVRFFEAKGITVRGAHEVAPGLLVLRGAAGALSLDRQGLADAELGFRVRAALGALDAGQAVVTEGSRVLAIEGAEGTDAMLRRVAGQRAARAGSAPSGVLAKGPKPGQELRVDMPTIGPRTVEGAAAAGLAGVAAEAGAVLLLDRADAIAAANACGIAIEGLTSERDPAGKPGLQMEQGAGHKVPSPLAGEGQGGGDSAQRGSDPSPRTSQISLGGKGERSDALRAPPTPGPYPQGGGEPQRAGGQRPRPTIAIAGGLQPDARGAADIEKGLAAIEQLAPFGTGKAVVVSRAYILGVAAAEPTLDLLERTRALRQWGVGANRRIGVVACRADSEGWDAAGVAALLDKAAAAGLAGVAVTGTPEALVCFERAGALADRHGLFLAIPGEQP
jgi:UDP-2,3-diacylglucosamine hydrolase